MTLSTLSDIPAEMDAMAPDLAAREADALCLETLASFWNAGPQNRQRALAFATESGHASDRNINQEAHRGS